MDTQLGFGRTLVLAPHPDDEVLGAGGTLARLAAEGQSVFAAIVTQGRQPEFSHDSVERVKAEAAEAHRALGVEETFWLGMPAASLGEVGHSALNAAISKVVRHVAPQTLLLPFVGDIHVDHQLTFLSGLVASRPHQTEFPKFVLAYETVSETNWNAPFLSPAFTPNIFVDISAHLETKLAAIKCYSSQLRSPPHERSLANLQALACVRGATVIREAAEGFVLVRAVL